MSLPASAKPRIYCLHGQLQLFALQESASVNDRAGVLYVRWGYEKKQKFIVLSYKNGC